MPINTKLKALAVTAALFVLPYFLLLCWFSWFNKDVVYLRGDGYGWMLNPEDQPVVNGFPNDLPAVYSTSFDLTAQPTKGVLKLMAVKSHELTVNGSRLSTLNETARLNWKRGSVYDITPYLRPGLNEISVLVRSPYSKSALRAEGTVTSAGGFSVPLDSGGRWSVTSAMVRPELGITGMPNAPEPIVHQSFKDRIASGDYWAGSFYIYGAACGLILLMLLSPGVSLRLDRAIAFTAPAFLYGLAVALVFCILAYVLYHNFLVYPAIRTGDFDAHVQYLNRMVASFRPPLASEGFQMYNPPIYYLASAALYRLFGPAGTLSDVVRYAQLVNTVSAFLTAVLLFFILRRVFKDRPVVFLSLLVAASLPMCIVKAPSISGDSTLTLLCTATFYLWLRYTEAPSWRLALLTGLGAGLCFLTRYTGLFVIMGLSAGFIYSALRGRASMRRTLAEMAAFLSVSLIVCGWYYARNILVFHHLFPINGTQEMFFFRQYPGYRDRAFYTDIKALFLNSPFGKANVTESFLAGSYTTFWSDGQRLLLGTQNVIPTMAALSLSLLPSLLIAHGAVKASASTVSKGGDGRAVFLAGCIFTLSMSLAAYALGTYSYPYYSMVKSFYIMFCIAPIACLFALGLEAWVARSGYLAITLYITCACALQFGIFLL